MTLLFFDGFQDAATMRKPEWSAVAFQMGSGRDGSTNGCGYPDASNAVLTLPSAAAVCNVGVALLFAQNGLNTNQYLTFRIGTTNHLSVNVNSSGYIELRLGSSGGTLLATATTGQFVTNSWRHVQIKATLHTSTGTVLVKVDGTTVLNYTGQTATAIGSVAALGFYQSTSTSVSQWRLDDLYVTDGVDGTATDGRPNNDLLGDLVVKTLLPTGAGDQTQWTPSTGANWAAVDEVPPSATDYVGALAASGLKDQYALADLPANAATVYGVRVGAYAAKSDAGSAGLKIGVKENSTITVVDSTAGALSTGYLPHIGALIKKKPSNGAVITPADVNAMQAAIEAA